MDELCQVSSIFCIKKILELVKAQVKDIVVIKLWQKNFKVGKSTPGLRGDLASSQENIFEIELLNSQHQ